jgi:hypothetical protein
MNSTTILNQIVALDIRDRIRLLQAIHGGISPEQVAPNFTELPQHELDRRTSLENLKTLHDQIVALDIRDLMLVSHGITSSIKQEQITPDILEARKWELNRIKDVEDQKTPYGQVALTFATALVNGKFEDAYRFLSPSIKDEWSPKLLKDTYEEMVEYFGDLPVNYISIGVVDTSLSDDCWVYVEIACDGCGEGIKVTIKAENEKYLIQEIEWGRP